MFCLVKIALPARWAAVDTINNLNLNVQVLGDVIAKDPKGLDSDRVRYSPIWIQPRGVFRFNPTPGS